MSANIWSICASLSKRHSACASATSPQKARTRSSSSAVSSVGVCEESVRATLSTPTAIAQATPAGISGFGAFTTWFATTRPSAAASLRVPATRRR
jgi:hypothetical protein